MGGIDPNTCPETFVFGKEGKPMFVAGPHENAARCQLIMNVLMKKCGKDGFLYICPLGDTEDGLLGEDEDEEEEEYEDGDDEEDGDDSHVRDLRSAIFDLSSPGKQVVGGIFQAVPEGFFEVATEDFRNSLNPH